MVKSGDVLALGGMTLYRRPVAFTRALLARDPRPDDLTLLCFTAAYASDLLIGAGMASAIRTCYAGFEAFGLAPMFTKRANAGDLTIIEETEVSLSAGIRATVSGLGFLPARGWIGTDLLDLRPDVKTITDPYSGEEIVAFPAIPCDVAVVHALRADVFGNCILGGNFAVDMELALTAETVILTAEEVVPRLTDHADFAGLTVTAVIEAPRGAWPTSCYPAYPIAGGEILRYIDACNAGAFDEYAEALANSSPNKSPNR